MSATSSSASAARERLRDLALRRAERHLAAGSSGHTPSVSREGLRSEVEKAISHHDSIHALVARLACTPDPSSDATAPRSAARKTPTPGLPELKNISVSSNQGGAESDAVSAAASRSAALTPSPRIAGRLRRGVAPTPLLPLPVDGKQEDNWAVLARRAAAEEEITKRRERLQRLRKLADQQRTLDDQVKLRSSRRELLKSSLTVEQQQLEEAAKSWEQQKALDRDQLREKEQRLRADCEEQARLRNERREEEKRQRSAMEHAILGRIHSEIEVAERQKEATKLRECRFKEELIAANEAQKKIKAARRASDAAHDQRSIEAMESQLTKQEASRTIAWEKMKAKMAGREVHAVSMLKTLDELEAIDEDRMIKHMMMNARVAEEKERRLREDAQRRARANAAAQVAQIEGVRDARNHEREAFLAERADVEAAVEREREVVERERVAAHQKKAIARQLLEEQMVFNQKRQFVVMSDEEMRLNSRLMLPAPPSPS